MILVSVHFRVRSQHRQSCPRWSGIWLAGFVLRACGYRRHRRCRVACRRSGCCSCCLASASSCGSPRLGQARGVGWSKHSRCDHHGSHQRGLLLGLGALGLPLAAGLSLQQAAGCARWIRLLVLEHRLCSEGARGTQRGHVIAGQTRGRHSGCSGHLRCCLSDSDSGDATIDLGDSRRPRGPRRQAVYRLATGQGWPWRAVSPVRLNPRHSSRGRIVRRGRAETRPRRTVDRSHPGQPFPSF